jgi:hypothetical protein
VLRLSRWEYLGLALFGLLIWAYVLIRVDAVFYITDELISKWAYMVPWHFMPYTGYVDANNHFLLSFLGGLFIRLFDCDGMALVRMPVALSFPLYAWSALQLGRYFKERWSLYSFYVVLLSCPLFLEFFGLARGYGLSLALLMWGIWTGRAYLANPRLKLLLISQLALVLAVCANLTLLPLVGLGLLLLGFHAWRHKRSWGLSILPGLFLLLALVKYAFDLKDKGKLYYGTQEGLVSNTLHSLGDMVLGSHAPWILNAWLMGMGALLLATILHLYRRGGKLDARYLFPGFLALSLANILGQHYLLGINFPADRTAIYLPLAFLGGLVAVLDLWKVGKGSVLAALGMGGVLVAQGNFTHTHTYSYEHFAPELVTKVPAQVQGIPPTTGARFWGLDNAMNRRLNQRILAFQDAPSASDTLYDYIIQLQELWPEEHPRYQAVYQDSISRLTLYERRPFLKRELSASTQRSFSGKQEYMGLWKKRESPPRIVRLKGWVQPLTIYSRVMVCVSQVHRETGKLGYLECLYLIANKQADAQGRVNFDFSLVVPPSAAGETAKVYLWNKEKQPLDGALQVASYRLGPRGD